MISKHEQAKWSRDTGSQIFQLSKAQFRYIKTQHKTIDPSTKLHRLCNYSPEPRAQVCCFRLKIGQLIKTWMSNIKDASMVIMI